MFTVWLNTHVANLQIKQQSILRISETLLMLYME